MCSNLRGGGWDGQQAACADLCGDDTVGDSCVVFAAGPLKGTAVVSVSATAGACLAFLVSRYLARPLVETKVAGEQGRCLSFPVGLKITHSSIAVRVRLVAMSFPNSHCECWIFQFASGL